VLTDAEASFGVDGGVGGAVGVPQAPLNFSVAEAVPETLSLQSVCTDAVAFVLLATIPVCVNVALQLPVRVKTPACGFFENVENVRSVPVPTPSVLERVDAVGVYEVTLDDAATPVGTLVVVNVQVTFQVPVDASQVETPARVGVCADAGAAAPTTTSATANIAVVSAAMSFFIGVGFSLGEGFSGNWARQKALKAPGGDGAYRSGKRQVVGK
jgi:hypothetical protein